MIFSNLLIICLLRQIISLDFLSYQKSNEDFSRNNFRYSII